MRFEWRRDDRSGEGKLVRIVLDKEDLARLWEGRRIIERGVLPGFDVEVRTEATTDDLLAPGYQFQSEPI